MEFKLSTLDQLQLYLELRDTYTLQERDVIRKTLKAEINNAKKGS